MRNNLTRRSFMKTAAAGVAAGTALNMTADSSPAAANAPQAAYRGTLRKSLYFSMFPKELSTSEKFQLAKRVGFEGVEIPTLETEAERAEYKEAAQGAGIELHSIMNQAHWGSPLSSADPAVVKKSIEGMQASLHTAKAVGAGTVLLVPGVVNAETMYKDAYVRSQKYIRELLPLAEELKVVIAVENVWNKFLLSPLEFKRYVEELNSPYLQAYFDVGNIVLYGFPQDWIRTLGKLINRVHIKGFDARNLASPWVNLGDGTIDWLEVRRALSDIEYSGWVNAELPGGDAGYLRDVSMRMDKIFAGEKIQKT